PTRRSSDLGTRRQHDLGDRGADEEGDRDRLDGWVLGRVRVGLPVPDVFAVDLEAAERQRLGRDLGPERVARPRGHERVVGRRARRPEVEAPIDRLGPFDRDRDPERLPHRGHPVEFYLEALGRGGGDAEQREQREKAERGHGSGGWPPGGGGGSGNGPSAPMAVLPSVAAPRAPSPPGKKAPPMVSLRWSWRRCTRFIPPRDSSARAAASPSPTVPPEIATASACWARAAACVKPGSSLAAWRNCAAAAPKRPASSSCRPRA